jgi:predicted RND superfamily exporter protein
MTTGNSLDRLSRVVVPWLLHRRRGVLLAAALLTLVGGIGTVLLYSDLRSGVEELLPENAPSVIAAKTVAPRMHTTTRLQVTLEGSDGDAIARFADDLAKRLRALPKTLVDVVEYRNDTQAAFVKQFGLLYVDTPDLKEIRDKLAARIEWERLRANPLSLIDAEDVGPAPEFDLKTLETKYGNAIKSASKYRNGYYQTPEGQILVMLIRPPEQSTGMGSNEKLFDAVKKEIAALGPTKYDPSLQVGYSGEVAELVEEQTALVEDLASSTIVVLVLVLGGLWAYYRHWGAIAAVFGPLLIGCAVTFGAAYLMIGHLNANTAFLGSIVIGNGINVGIIYVARYLEARRAKTAVDEAIRIAWVSTMPATFVAAFGAGVAYFSLAATDFRGFNQFGQIGGVGMGICWVAVYAFLPSIIATIEHWRPIDAGGELDPERGLGRFTRLVERYPMVFRVLSVVLVLACFGAVARYEGDLVEYDMSKLRSKKSTQTGSMFWSKKGDEVFKEYLTPLVLWGDTPADLDKVVDTLNRHRKELGEADPFREIQSLHVAIPAGQDEKVAVINEITEMLTPGRLKKLAPDLREKIEQIKPDGEIRPVTLQDLPEALHRALAEKDGTVGRVALAFPKKVGNINLHEAGELKKLIRGAIMESGAKAQAFTPLLLLSDIDDAIWHDGPKATVIAFALVCLLVVLVFRKFKPSLQVIGALLAGLAGLIGAAAAVNVRVNFLNFVVLPITFGIGVDYAVNIIQRYEREGREALGRILRETGGAVALCSATTIVGYGSLVVADSQALAGFGLLASVGEITCLVAALFLLPAWLFPRPPRPGESLAAEGTPEST